MVHGRRSESRSYVSCAIHLNLYLSLIGGKNLVYHPIKVVEFKFRITEIFTADHNISPFSKRKGHSKVTS